MAARSIPGLSLAITKNGTLALSASYGHAYLDPLTPLTNAYRFRTASVSKTITALAIMRLVESGHLHLHSQVFGDDGILQHKYGTGPYSNRTKRITVQNLLEHASGYVNDDMCGEGCDPTYLEKWLALDQHALISSILDAYEPSYEPGTFASYSNFGYFILGRIVEAASSGLGSLQTPNRTYASFVRDDVLKDPALDISDMCIADEERRANEVVYYARADEKPDAPYTFHVHRRDSVGAWIATATDLVRVITSLSGLPHVPQSLNATTRALMFEPSAVEDSDFAKGWAVRTNGDGEDVVEAWKDGSYSGTNAMIRVDFANATGYAVLVNSQIANEGPNGTFHDARDLKDLMDSVVEEYFLGG